MKAIRTRKTDGTYSNRLTDGEIENIKKMRCSGDTITKISEVTGVSKTHVHRLCVGIANLPRPSRSLNTGIRNSYVVHDKHVSIEIVSKGKIMETLVSLEDWEKIKSFSTRWYAHYSKNNKTYYAMCKNRFQPHIQLHRFIMEPSEDMLVDHIFHNTLDNRRSELRIVTKSENKSNPKAPTKGIHVHWYPKYNKWSAKLYFNKKKHHVGYFIDYDTAVEAVNEARERLI